ncbi:hypothetical protein [uncultured Methylobacterium sp.]|jgi:hypothetical protein|uniref:hypothetical protein n=1 Tax=uncultured Methylobacterium sp. TaxID=157278 RepID=UPI002609D2C1|nr:hypothetical protein [uncultured Methylobacterium sp.]
MRLFGRLLVMGFALLLAIPAGTTMLGLGTLMDAGLRELLGRLGLYAIDSVLSELAAGYPPDPGMLDALLGAGRAVLLLLAVPPALNAVVGEVLRWRSLVWYAGATGLLTACLPWLMRASRGDGAAGPLSAGETRVAGLLFAAGAVSGLVYWLLAGRFAGRGEARMWVPARR